MKEDVKHTVQERDEGSPNIFLGRWQVFEAWWSSTP